MISDHRSRKLVLASKAYVLRWLQYLISDYQKNGGGSRTYERRLGLDGLMGKILRLVCYLALQVESRVYAQFGFHCRCLVSSDEFSAYLVLDEMSLIGMNRILLMQCPVSRNMYFVYFRCDEICHLQHGGM